MPRKVYRSRLVLSFLPVAFAVLAGVKFVSHAQENPAPESPATGTLDGQLWFMNNGGPLDPITGHLNTDGNNVTQEGQQLASDQGQTMAVDIAAGYYFCVCGHLSIETHSVSNPSAIIDTVQIGNDLNTPSGADDDIVNALAVDPTTHTIYVGLWGQDLNHTGIVKVNYNTATGALDHSAAYGTGGVYANTQQFLITSTSTGGKITDPRDFTIDLVNHKLYWTDDDNQYSLSPFSPTNNISVVTYNSGTPSSTVVQLTSNANVTGGFPTNQSLGIIGPMTVDVAKGLVYFETNHVGNSTGTLWYVPITSGPATATQMGLPGGTAVGFGDIPQGGLAIDPQSQYFFITVQSGTIFAGPDQILQGVLSADGHSVTSFVNTYSLQTLDGHAPAANAHVADTWFDQLPTLTSLNGTATHASELGSAVTLLTGAPTITDTDGDHLSSATVQITGGTFSSNETSANDDHLTINALASGTSGNLSFSYNSATETMTITGYDTWANYQAILALVKYNTTGHNPTNYGNNLTRTITWTASDGARNVPNTAQNSGTTTVTIDAVNDAPVNNGVASKTGNEDTLIPITGLSMTDVDADPASAAQTITVQMTVSHGTLTYRTDVASGLVAGDITGNGTNNVVVTQTQNKINATLANATGLQYKGVQDYNSGDGPESIQIVTNDNGHTGSGGALTDTDNLSVTVNPVNDVPSFTKGADQTVLEDAGAQTVNGWATNLSKGPANESSQTLSFIVSNNNNPMFSVQPSVSATGVLSYTPAPNANGTALVSVQIHDDGGTANGGVDTSAIQTFNINVTAVNDVPSFTKGPDKTVLEDAGGQTFASWATAISAGPSDESGQTLNFIVSNDNNPLFSVQPAVASNGTLTFTPAANANGTTIVSVQIHDNGGTANGGVDTSAIQTFNITVTAVNDVPSFTKGADQTNVIAGSGAKTVPAWATNLSPGGGPDEAGQTLNFIVSNNNNGLFSSQPAVDSTGQLTFTPAVGVNGSATVSVQIHDNGGTANGGVDTSAIQ
ncbi:MAG: hypothetical protein JO314_02630, partial [Acidobacteria bacterium]|nr:hypothetical protein [Acidobacteriota bacterium]